VLLRKEQSRSSAQGLPYASSDTDWLCPLLACCFEFVLGVTRSLIYFSSLLSCHVLASLQVRLGPGQGFPDEAYGATALFAQCACESQTYSQLQ